MLNRSYTTRRDVIGTPSPIGMSTVIVMAQKGVDGRQPRTWVAITRNGRVALRKEIAALKALVNRFDATLGRHS